MPKYLIKRLIEKSGDDMKNETGKREKLIMSAIGLFAEYGYDKVSIRTDCGRSKGCHAGFPG